MRQATLLTAAIICRAEIPNASVNPPSFLECGISVAASFANLVGAVPASGSGDSTASPNPPSG